MSDHAFRDRGIRKERGTKAAGVQRAHLKGRWRVWVVLGCEGVGGRRQRQHFSCGVLAFLRVPRSNIFELNLEARSRQGLGELHECVHERLRPEALWLPRLSLFPYPSALLPTAWLSLSFAAFLFTRGRVSPPLEGGAYPSVKPWRNECCCSCRANQVGVARAHKLVGRGGSNPGTQAACLGFPRGDMGVEAEVIMNPTGQGFSLCSLSLGCSRTNTYCFVEVLPIGVG